MPVIRVSDEAAEELKRRAVEQRRTIGAVVDVLLEDHDRMAADLEEAKAS